MKYWNCNAFRPANESFLTLLRTLLITVYNNMETTKEEASSQGFERDGQCDYCNVLSRNPYELNKEKYEIF